MDIDGRDGGGEQHASSVDEVVLGADPATVYGVGTGLLAPLLAGTLAESRVALDQSTPPKLPNRSRRTFSSRRQTPALVHSTR